MITIDKKLSDNGKESFMQANLQLLPLIMNNIPQAVFWKDHNLVYLGCNQAFADDAGFSSPEDIVGKTDFDMPWKDQAELYRSDDQLVMEKGEPKLNYEEPQTTPDGSTTWLRTSKIPVHENNQVVAVLGMYEDITEHKQTEVLLQSMIEDAPEAIGIVDLTTGLFTNPNENSVKLYGLSREELLNVGPAQMSPPVQPDGRSSTEKAMEKINAAMQGEDQVFEWMHCNAQGENILCEVRLARLPGKHPQVRFSATDITSRKQVEQDLRDSEARYSAVVTQAKDGVVIIQDNIIQFANKALADMLGYVPSEMENTPIINYIAPESRALIVNRIKARLAGEEVPSTYESKLQRKDGTIIDAELSAGMIDYHGKPADVGLIRDVTERKRIDGLVQASEERFRRFTEATVEGLVFHVQGKIIDVNPAAIAMFGFSDATKLINKSLLGFIAPEFHNLVLKQMQLDSVSSYEVQCIRSDGSTFPVETSTRAYKIGDQEIRASSIRDITERKRVEDELQASRERSANIIEFLPDATLVTDRERRVIAWNRAIEEMTGVKKEDILGKGDFAYAVPFYGEARPMLLDSALDQSQVPDRYESVQKQSNSLSAEIYVPSVYNGRGAYLFVTSSPLYDSNGEIVGAIESIRDITENKKLEAQVQEAFERRGLQVQLSTQVSQSIAAATSLEDLYQRVVSQVKEQFGYYHTQLLRYDSNQNAVVLVTGYGKIGETMLAGGHRMSMGKGLIGTAAATGETVVRPTLENDPDWHANPILPDTKGEIAVPIKLGNTILGVLDVQSDTAGALNTDDQLLLEGLCGQIAIAIESTRLQQEMAERLEEINRLYQAMSREGWQAYRENADIPKVFMFDQNGLKQQVSDTELANKLFTRFPLTVPGGDAIGNLSILDDPQRPVSPDEKDFVQQVSEQVAIALESARLFEQTQDALQDAQEAESVVRASEAKLTEALEIAKLANWEYDVEKDIFTFNDQFFSIFHTTAEEMGGYELPSAVYAQRLVHPEDAHIVGAAIEKALTSTDKHYSAQLEHRVIYSDGGIGHIAVEIHIERDDQGKITRYYGANQDITERKIAELAVRAGEAKLAEALNIAKLANWEYDLEKDLFLFNDQFYSIFHTTAEEMGGYELPSAVYAQRLVHPEDAHVVGAAIEKALASTNKHYSTQLEHRVIYADGGIGHISVEIHIDRDDQGKITRYYGANQDITERKIAELAVRAGEAKLAEALEIAKLANWEYDVEKDIFTFNDQFFSIFHTTAEEMGGYELPSAVYAQRLVHPEDAHIVGAAIEKALTSTDKHYSAQLEHRVIYSDGGIGHISVEIHIERDDQGKITRYYGANQDITERKIAEQIVAKRATELETVAKVSATTSTVLDPDKLLQTVVDITKERFGLYHAHIYLADEDEKTLFLAAGAGEIGKQMVANGWNIQLNHEQSIVAKAARDKKPVVANDVVHEKDSSFLSNQLLPDTRSEIAVPMIVGEKVLGIFDVQSDKANYFSQEDVNIFTTLASQVAIALQNARLYMEQAATVTQLRELDRLKSAFLANMSHELRTPLNSILGFTDVMLEGLDGDLTDYMDNDLRLIQKNGRHLLHLINDVLDMAKIESGRMNLNPESFKVHDLLEEVNSITSTLASEKNLSLFIDDDSDRTIEIYADNTRIRQVMINLVNNSIKFTETGKITLSVKPIDGARVLIAVKDTGIGIPPDHLEAVFQEFTQVDTTTTRKASGTGLGLPISRRLIEMHGGKLWGESTGVNGEGSTFFVELPLEAQIADVIEKQEK